MKSRKNLIIIALVVLVSVVGLSYAFFNYYQVSQRNLQLITGEIYLRLNEGTEQISLINAFPETAEEARARDDNYITFTITGKNTTTNKDIHYEIDLTEGDEVSGRTRLNASDLRFDLIEVRGDEEVYLAYDESFSDLNNHKVWIDDVVANTTDDVERLYKLRMWISEDVLISDTDSNASYTTGEYKNSYASVKLLVAGDFGTRYTDESCFTVEAGKFSNASLILTSYETNITDETLASCKTIMTESFYNSDGSDAQDGYQSFCEGTGTVLGSYSMDKILLINFMSIRDKLMEANYLTRYGMDDEPTYFSLIETKEAKESCENYLTTNNLNIDELFCSDKEVFKSEFLGLSQSHIEALEESGVIRRDDGPIASTYQITDYDTSCGTEVFIPKSINGIPVIFIGTRKSDNKAAFNGKNLTRVIIPDGITYGQHGTFDNNNLKSVVLPVSYINGSYLGFNNNKLEYIYLPEGITNVNSLSNNNLEYIHFPSTVVEIDGLNNNKLKSVDIPLTVTKIWHGAFNNNLMPDDEAFIYARTDTDGDGVAEIDYTTLVSYAGVNDDVVVPEGVVNIGSWAFHGCSINSVVLPTNLLTLGSNAFFNNNLTEIDIPDTVTTIGTLAFHKNSLTELVLPDSVTTLEKEALKVGNSLKSITIGSGITYIDNYAFQKDGSGGVPFNRGLTSVTINKTCAEIKAIKASSSSSTIYYPWLSNSSPYTAKNVTIYGANGEVCDTY